MTTEVASVGCTAGKVRLFPVCVCISCRSIKPKSNIVFASVDGAATVPGPLWLGMEKGFSSADLSGAVGLVAPAVSRGGGGIPRRLSICLILCPYAAVVVFCVFFQSEREFISCTTSRFHDSRDAIRGKLVMSNVCNESNLCIDDVSSPGASATDRNISKQHQATTYAQSFGATNRSSKAQSPEI